MQLLVIIGFAVVLSIPVEGWRRVWFADSWLSLAAVAGQCVVPWLLAMVGGAMVRRRVSVDPSIAGQFFSRVGFVVRLVIVGGLLLTMIQSAWPSIVRQEWGLGQWLLVDELVLLAPFLVSILMVWWAGYSAEMALRSRGGRLERPWTRWQYMVFQVRHQMLLVAGPMVVILLVQDLADRYHATLVRVTGAVWASDAAMVVAAACLFLLAPLIVRRIWSTEPMASGRLHDRLVRMCDRVGLRYRAILLWRSDQMVINAAVMGLVRPVRYLLLSDGLVASMEDRQIEAVFGHEAGHVKKYHLLFYGLFAAASGFAVGGVIEAATRWGGWRLNVMDQEFWALTMGVLAVAWLGGFGAVSRRFERQADLFAMGCLADDPEAFVGDGVADAEGGVGEGAGDKNGEGIGDRTGGADVALDDRRRWAADVYAGTLLRVALLNGMSPRSRSWRHSSIASRMAFVQKCAADPLVERRFQRQVAWVKGFLVAVTVVGSVIGGYLYWPAGWWPVG